MSFIPAALFAGKYFKKQVNRFLKTTQDIHLQQLLRKAIFFKIIAEVALVLAVI